MKCAGCGYVEGYHVGPDRRCPVCVCGEVVGAHGSYPETPMPLVETIGAATIKMVRPCPGKDTQLRHGKYRTPPPVDTASWAEIMQRESAARRAADDELKRPYVPEVVHPPVIAARPPSSADEYAGYRGKQAVGLGRLATAAGWTVEPAYWRAHDETEGCAVRLSKGPLRAVATWTRPAGRRGSRTGWAVDVAYAWRTDVQRFPMKITHTELGKLIT